MGSPDSVGTGVEEIPAEVLVAAHGCSSQVYRSGAFRLVGTTFCRPVKAYLRVSCNHTSRVPLKVSACRGGKAGPFNSKVCRLPTSHVNRDQKCSRKGIDGRAPPGVEPVAQFDSTRENLPGPDIVRIDRLRALS